MDIVSILTGGSSGCLQLVGYRLSSILVSGVYQVLRRVPQFEAVVDEYRCWVLYYYCRVWMERTRVCLMEPSSKYYRVLAAWYYTVPCQMLHARRVEGRSIPFLCFYLWLWWGIWICVADLSHGSQPCQRRYIPLGSVLRPQFRVGSAWQVGTRNGERKSSKLGSMSSTVGPPRTALAFTDE